MNDPIERQDVLNLLDSVYQYMGNWLVQYIEDGISSIPPVQPEIVMCKDCKHWINGHLCESLSRFGSFETKEDFYCGYAKRRIDDKR